MFRCASSWSLLKLEEGGREGRRDGGDGFQRGGILRIWKGSLIMLTILIVSTVMEPLLEVQVSCDVKLDKRSFTLVPRD